MKQAFSRLFDLLYLMGVAIVLFTVGRIMLLYVNIDNFGSFDGFEIIDTLFKGILYDFYVVFILNSFFIFLYLYHFKIYNSNFYQLLLKLFYILVNSLALLTNLMDISYYKSHGKRLDFNSFGDEIIGELENIRSAEVLEIFKNNLNIVVLWIAMVLILSYAVWFIKERFYEHKHAAFINKPASIILFVAIWALSFIFLNDKYTWLMNVHSKVNRQMVPVLINNPYLIFHTIETNDINDGEYWYIENYSPVKKYSTLDRQENKHVRIILIDSYRNTNFLSGLNQNHASGKSFKMSVLELKKNTLFHYLDQILISIPTVLNEDFYQSVYSLNRFQNLVQILEKEYYQTKIFTFGYDRQTVKLIRNFYGFKNYKILTDEDLDKLENILSPVKEKYADNSHQFELFLFHLSAEANETQEVKITNFLSLFSDSLNIKHSINFIYLIPSNEIMNEPELNESMLVIMDQSMNTYIKPDSIICQPIDLMPSILHYINYGNRFISYGSSLFSDDDNAKVISSDGENYYLLKDSLLLNYSDKQTISLHKLNNSKFSGFDYKDSLAIEKIQLENIVQSIIEDYYQRLRDNELF